MVFPLMAAPCKAAGSGELWSRAEDAGGPAKAALLAEAARLAWKDDPVRAGEAAEEALALLPEDPEADIEFGLLETAARAFMETDDPAAARRHIEALREKAEERGSRRAALKARLLEAQLQLRRERPDEALGLLKPVLRDMPEEADPETRAEIYNAAGEANRLLDKIDRSLDYHLRALEICERAGAVYEEALTLLELGNVYNSLGVFDTAAAYFVKALDLFEQEGGQTGKALALTALGNSFRMRGKLEKAEDCLTRAAEIYETLGSCLGPGKVSLHLGHVYLKKDIPETAAEHFRKALEIFSRRGRESLRASARTGLAGALICLKRYEEALRHARAVESFALAQGNSRNLMWSHRLRYRAYWHMGDNRKALAHLEKAAAIQAENALEDKQAMMDLLKIKTGYEARENEIELLEAQNAIKTKSLALQKKLRNVFVGAFFALAALAAGLLLLYRAKNREHKDLLRTKKELTDTNAELKHAIENASAKAWEAAAANRAKSAFLNTLSYQLRHPLNAIVGIGGLLPETALNQRQKEYFSAIRGGCEALTGVLNNLNDYASMEDERVSLENKPFDINECIREVCRMFRPETEEKGLRLEYRPTPRVPDMVSGDQQRVRQIFLNLVENAVKHSSKGQILITGELENADAEGCYLRFGVKDEGEGISKERLGHLFQFHSQDAAANGKAGGTGLGLAICKRLCLMMGGDIRAESVPGQGSHFTFSLKLGKPPEGASPPPSKKTGAEPMDALKLKEPVSVLVAEDNRINQKVMRLLLKKVNQTADAVFNGKEALDAVLNKRYDLVLMDVYMPGGGGLEAARNIRAQVPAERQPYIVALTAAAGKKDQEECAGAGMDDFLAKPVELENLIQTLNRFEEKRRAGGGE